MKRIKFAIFVGVLVAVALLSSQGILYAEKGQEHGPQGTKNEHSGPEHAATFGNVEKIHGNTLTIEDTEKNASLEADIDKDTKVFGVGKKLLRLNQINKHDKVVVIGSESAQLGKKELHAIKLFVKPASASAQMKRRAVEGVVSSISGSTITLVHQIHQDRSYAITVTAATQIKLKGTEDATLASIQVGQRIVVIGDLGSGNTLIAKRIHVIPGKAKGIALPSTTPNSSPSATVSPSETIVPSITETVTPTLTESPTPTNTPTPTP